MPCRAIKAVFSLGFTLSNSGSPAQSHSRQPADWAHARECAFNAEGCGQEPAGSCDNPEPFPGGYESGVGVYAYTIADAAKRLLVIYMHTCKTLFGWPGG